MVNMLVNISILACHYQFVSMVMLAFSELIAWL